MGIVKIADLKELKDESPDYVQEQITGRIADIQSLPNAVKEILHASEHLLDVGPGEGTSSMALASVFPEVPIIGLEMDRKHLTAAWPTCNKYPNLELYWGALNDNEQDKKVDAELILPNLSDEFDEKNMTVFSWLGISRADIFEKEGHLAKLSQNTCVLVIPKIWRAGLESDKTVYELVIELAARNNMNFKPWNKSDLIPGFDLLETYPIQKTVSARGWMLWLSGVFEGSDITFWDTLRDRRSAEPFPPARPWDPRVPRSWRAPLQTGHPL